MKKIFILLLFASVPAFSQTLTSMQYSMGFGTGNLSEFIGAPSFRGFTFDVRKLVQPNIAAGIELGWNVFYDERPYDSYSIGTLSYSGKQYRYNNQFPMLVRFDYYLRPGEQVSPFAGFGLGTMYTMRTTDMGQYRFEDNGWHFAIKPEFGVEYEVNPAFALVITGKYYYGFATGDITAHGYFALNVGAVFKN